MFFITLINKLDRTKTIISRNGATTNNAIKSVLRFHGTIALQNIPIAFHKRININTVNTKYIIFSNPSFNIDNLYSPFLRDKWPVVKQ